MSEVLVLSLLHCFLNVTTIFAESLFKKFKLLLNVLTDVLSIKLGNRVKIHDDLRCHILECSTSVDFPASPLKLGHVEGFSFFNLAILHHFMQDTGLQE